MSQSFFSQPVLNSPYDYPAQHWELDSERQPTDQILPSRRRAEFITPIPKARQRRGVEQQEMLMDDGTGLSTQEQQYDLNSAFINAIREKVDQWRQIPDSSRWGVTPETERLLKHWRHHPFAGIRPFFCQVEAVETLIWLTEVAPRSRREAGDLLITLERANLNANPELMRIALKLATGAGKTTVMAMIIAWQVINAVRRPNSKSFTRGFLIVAPGLTIKDRLRVLLPNDSENYYKHRELVPQDLLGELGRASIVITNYHSFKLRERMELSKGNRRLLQGQRGEAIQTLETEGQMIQRVMPNLMGLRNVLVINDEAHHCYREKPNSEEETGLKGEDKKEADKNKEAARLWISGIEAVNRKLGVNRVVDLSATPFFLRGSGYAEGTLFPWTVSDFSLMDAIECGIVKLPRVPVADNAVQEALPMYRELWKYVGKKMPKKGRSKGEPPDPLSIPVELQTALETLYGHYEQTFHLWQKEQISVPPCFIVVCNNTSSSKLVYDYISGFEQAQADGTTRIENGRLALFRNFDEHEQPLSKPRTLLIDSEQLESGEALDKNFREMAAPEIDRFRREIIERTGDVRKAENLSDAELLREVMNTVGKPGRLGEGIRCVVSVSMLTEGWDANNVTHILGVRAFGTQLLCEQVIGRALRRNSYEVNESGLFNVEYADVFGIPFDFTAKPVVAPPQPPRETVHVRALPEREELEIQFPRVLGYRTELPGERLTAEFTEESTMVLTPEMVGATRTQNQGIIGEEVQMGLEHLDKVRPSTLTMHLTRRLIYQKFRDPDTEPQLHLFGSLKSITSRWLKEHLECRGGTYPAQLMYTGLADEACERITAAITRHYLKEKPVRAMLDPYNPTGSTRHVSFNTSRPERYQTDSRKCHINWVMLDSNWEAEFCRVVEAHPWVKAYAKNHNLGLEVPYRYGSEVRRYLPDFIVVLDNGGAEPLHLLVEIKGYRRADANAKKSTMETYWIPGVNHLGTYGRWAFAEFRDVYEIEADFEAKVAAEFDQLVREQMRPDLTPEVTMRAHSTTRSDASRGPAHP
jgi:type III restriction enzyme